MSLLLLLALSSIALAADTHGYVDSRVCTGCHRDIAASQATTNMARTWHGVATSQLPPDYARTHLEGGVEYRVSRSGKSFRFEVAIPGRPKFDAPVETIMGGQRHGLSFLYRISEIDGLELARPALVEGRYLHSSPKGDLILSPGFPEEAPTTYETALGRVLSPQFETKCLACHGSAKTRESHETGVRCENCHGPAEAHLKSVADGQPRYGVLNPARLNPVQQIETCEQCHAGFGDLQDSIPDDLLISNQVNALKKSQCWVQSGGAFSCTACHNPHKDGGVAALAVKTCQGCHGETVANRAALCPVNQHGDCLGCHMPVAEKSSFHMVDHWIRVHPEQNVKAATHDARFRSKVRPKLLELRMIVTNDRPSADAAYAALQKGDDFFDVAQKFSKDTSALGGGYIGAMKPGEMDARLIEAVLNIDKGAYTPAVEVGPRWMIVERMPRDFLYDAEQLEQEGSRFRKAGDLDRAIDAYTRALRIYPRFLRALVFLGASYGQQGNPARGAAILEYAAGLYPDDPAAQYNLGIAYEALGRAPDALRAYNRAITLQPDLIPAYLNLGSLLFQVGRLDDAARAYERGLNENPLTASLYYNVAQVYEKQGKAEEAKHAAALAGKIDPQYAAHAAR